MPRRLILSATERDTLLALPESQDDLIRYYTFNDSDLSLIRQRRGDANRLGFAVQLCLLRYPGYALGTDSELPEPVILWVAKQVQAERGREAWTLGQGMKKPVAGCYGRLTRWKGGGDVVYMALL